MQVEGRIKSLSSVMRKVVAKSSWERWGWEGVTDWLGVRLVLLPRPELEPEAAERCAVEVGPTPCLSPFPKTSSHILVCLSVHDQGKGIT